MNPQKEFLRHASECEQMARFTRDPESRITWNRMAERWRQCASKIKRDSEAAGEHAPRKKYRRNIAPGWGPPSLIMPCSTVP
jgi:hypothetical protein